MKLLSILLAVATAALTAFSSVSAQAATPSYTPCTSGACYNDPAVLSNLGPWAANIKPRSEYFGQGGAPFLTKLRWPTYKHGKAVAHGLLHAIKSGCAPTYQCKYHTVKVTWKLTRPRWCNNSTCGGGWYYSVGVLTYTSSIKLAAQRRWTVNTKTGYWQ